MQTHLPDTSSAPQNPNTNSSGGHSLRRASMQLANAVYLAPAVKHMWRFSERVGRSLITNPFKSASEAFGTKGGAGRASCPSLPPHSFDGRDMLACDEMFSGAGMRNFNAIPPSPPPAPAPSFLCYFYRNWIRFYGISFYLLTLSFLKS